MHVVHVVEDTGGDQAAETVPDLLPDEPVISAPGLAYPPALGNESGQ